MKLRSSRSALHKCGRRPKRRPKPSSSGRSLRLLKAPSQQRNVPPQRPAPPQRLVPARQEAVYAEPALAEIVEPEEIDRTRASAAVWPTTCAGPRRLPSIRADWAKKSIRRTTSSRLTCTQVFDHDLGRLKKTASETADTPAATAVSDVTVSELLKLLRSPGSIRDAIIMSEVLKCPDDRW